jgi:hypothetical protein
MPFFTATGAIAAGATAYPLANWQFRQPNFPAVLEILINATAAGVVHGLTTGAESIVQAESPVSAGGTAGVLPARINSEAIVDGILPGEEIVHSLRNTSGAPITYNAVYVLTPKV